ncbi:hypothetical protein ACHAW5_007276 [Stephanodiscus triporus]|uniref:Nudix hydrolase domain-containing protein n=1 Tax=Stephanodiscus triporus TaxID=2934178 RepID=A0ABD3N9U6_9STRA
MPRCLIVLLLVLAILGADAAQSPTTTPAASGAAFYPRGRDRPHKYEILDEVVRYSGWRRVVRRSVVDRRRAARGKKVVEYDVIDHANSSSGGAVVVFAWNSTSRTATIVREYMPGPHRVLCGLAAGIVEDDGKHSEGGGGGTSSASGSEMSSSSSSLVAARFELEEECHLAGGTWYRLTDEGVSVPMDKYVVTEITPYLVIDAEHVPDPRPLDDEEDIEIVRGVTAAEILRMIREGDFNLVGGWGALLALEKLRELVGPRSRSSPG